MQVDLRAGMPFCQLQRVSSSVTIVNRRRDPLISEFQTPELRGRKGRSSRECYRATARSRHGPGVDPSEPPAELGGNENRSCTDVAIA
jgi:hypothetical protein